MNRSSGTGSGVSVLSALRDVLSASYGESAVSAVVIEDHLGAVAETRSFLRSGGAAPAAVFVGGGGGTLRAVIEAACASLDGGGLPGPNRLRIAPLRLGSGNVLAKKLEVPRDPVEATRAFVRNLGAGKIAPCCVGRYDFERAGGEIETRYAATLAGFGQLGRVPSDLERWHRKLPGLRRALAARVGIERLTNVEYGLSLLWRFAFCAAFRSAAERVSIDGAFEVRVLAGAVLNFPVGALPFAADTALGESKMLLHVVPYRSRLQALTLLAAPRRAARRSVVVTISASRPVELRLVDRDSAEMFLDEDPILIHRTLTISIAGTLTFIPGAS